MAGKAVVVCGTERAHKHIGIDKAAVYDFSLMQIDNRSAVLRNDVAAALHSRNLQPAHIGQNGVIGSAGTERNIYSALDRFLYNADGIIGYR